MKPDDLDRYDYAWWATISRGHAVAFIRDRLGGQTLVNRNGLWLTLCEQGPLMTAELRPITETTSPLCAICIARYDELAFTQPREDARQ